MAEIIVLLAWTVAVIVVAALATKAVMAEDKCLRCSLTEDRWDDIECIDEDWGHMNARYPHGNGWMW
jgi:hypothetical protein